MSIQNLARQIESQIGEECITGFIGEGTAATPNPVLGWVGSLTHVEIGLGYWFKIKDECITRNVNIELIGRRPDQFAVSEEECLGNFNSLINFEQYWLNLIDNDYINTNSIVNVPIGSNTYQYSIFSYLSANHDYVNLDVEFANLLSEEVGDNGDNFYQDVNLNQYAIFTYNSNFSYLDITAEGLEYYENQLAFEVSSEGDNFHEAEDGSEYAIFPYEENYQYGVPYLDFLNDFYLGIFNPTPDEDEEYNWYDECLEPDFDGFCFTFEEQDNGMSRVRFILDTNGEGLTGFQFNFPQTCITGYNESEDFQDYTVSYTSSPPSGDENGNVLLGFSFTNEIIPNGEYLTGDEYLIDIECNTPGGCTECFGDYNDTFPNPIGSYVIVSDDNGNSVPVTYPQPPPPDATPFEGFLDLDDWFMGGQSNNPINNILTELDDTINYSLGEIINENGLFGTNENGLPSYAVFNYQENTNNEPFEYLDRSVVFNEGASSVDETADNVEYLRNTLFTLTNDYTNDGILFIDFDNGEPIIGSGEFNLQSDDEVYFVTPYQEGNVYIPGDEIGVQIEYPDIYLQGGYIETISYPMEQNYWVDGGQTILNNLRILHEQGNIELQNGDSVLIVQNDTTLEQISYFALWNLLGGEVPDWFVASGDWTNIRRGAGLVMGVSQPMIINWGVLPVGSA